MQFKEKTATLEWMKTIRRQNNKPSEQQKVDNNQLLTILATQLQENAPLKFPYELQQTSSGDIELTFDKVEFNLFIAWLEKINKHYAMNIKQFNAERSKTAGFAHVRVLLNTA